MRILLIEDERKLADYVRKGLTEHNYVVDIARDGVDGRHAAIEGDYDVVVLDVMLPGVDGFGVLADLRKHKETPVLMLTARDKVEDRVRGLEGGADDYLAKPFRFEELVARIRRRLRDDRSPESLVLTCGGLTLDLRSRQATVSGRTVDLSAREFALAEMLLRHAGQVLSREQLLDHVWGYDFDPSSNVVDVYIRHLRRKLGPDRITTLRRMGYRLEDLP